MRVLKLLGLLVMRDLMLAAPDTLLADVMLRDPFTLDPDLEGKITIVVLQFKDPIGG